MRHDPRTEAFERLGGAYEVRVIEPASPAVAEPPWFADDPAARGEVLAGRKKLRYTRRGFGTPWFGTDQRATALGFCRARLEALVA